MENISLIPTVPSDLDLQENERIFAKAIDNYWHTDTTKHSEQFYKEQLETMWWCVYKACTCVCKSIYKSRGTIVDDLDEVIMDSTEYTMRFLTGKNRLGRIYIPRNLGTFVFTRCRHIIDDLKRQWYDKNIVPMPQDNYREIDMEVDDEYGCY